MKRIKKELIKAMKTIPKLMPDILAVCGAATISYGGYLIAKPFGCLLLGAMLIASAVVLSKSK